MVTSSHPASVKSVRSNISMKAVDLIVEEAAKRYKAATGKELPGKIVVFLKNYMFATIELIEKASDGKLRQRDIAAMALKKALAMSGLAAGDASVAACGTALAGLALATVEAYGEMNAGVALAVAGSETVIGSVPGIALVISSIVFYGYQVDAAAQSCGDAYVAQIEKQYARNNLASKRVLINSKADAMCRVPGR